jgi:plasmid stabilization system protein ParE
MSSYVFHPDAFADRDEIWENVAENNVDASDRVLADIDSTLTTLAGSPQIGHRRPDLTTRPLRFHVVREYHIAYAPAESRFGSWRCFTAAEIRDLWRQFFATESKR